VPTLEEAKLNLPGCALASAMSSLTEVTGKLGLVTKIDGAFDKIEIGAKSFKKSYPGSLNKDMFTVFVMVQSSNV
jgi:hypothetical protein